MKGLTFAERHRIERELVAEAKEKKREGSPLPEAQQGHVYDNGKSGDKRIQITLPLVPSFKLGYSVTLEMMPIFVGLVCWPWFLLLCWHIFRELMGWPTFTVLNPEFDMMMVGWFGG